MEENDDLREPNRINSKARSAGIDTNRRVVKEDSLIPQNEGDSVPESGDVKRFMYTKIVPRTTAKDVDSPMLLKQINKSFLNRKQTFCMSDLVMNTKFVRPSFFTRLQSRSSSLAVISDKNVIFYYL